MVGGRAFSPAGSSAMSEPQRKRVIRAVYFVTALEVTLMFLQFSVTPYLAKKLGFDTLWFGYLQTTVGVLQLLGGPVLGRFADIFGARIALSTSCAATVVSFLLLAIANHPAMLFIQKLPALFMRVIPASQMVVTDLTKPEKRAEALSKLGVCFGIGMIAGSTLGGQLVKHYGESFAAYVAVVGGVINLLLVFKYIPKSTKEQPLGAKAEESTAKQDNRNQSIFSVGEITRLMRFPTVTWTFLVKIAAGFPSGVFQSMFAIIAMDVYKLQPEQNGYLMAYIGIVQMIIQGGVLGRLTAKYSERSLLLLSLGLSALVGLAQAYMQNVFQLCLTVVPMMFSLSVFSVITDTMLTQSVPSSDTGTMLGLCASVQSLIRTVGPTAGGFLYVNYGFPSLGILQFVVNIAIFVYMLQFQVVKKSEQKL